LKNFSQLRSSIFWYMFWPSGDSLILGNGFFCYCQVSFSEIWHDPVTSSAWHVQYSLGILFEYGEKVLCVKSHEVCLKSSGNYSGSSRKPIKLRWRNWVQLSLFGFNVCPSDHQHGRRMFKLLISLGTKIKIRGHLVFFIYSLRWNVIFSECSLCL